jgi:hypothetical protein
MDLSFLQNYVVTVILALCLCVGYIIKHCIPTDKINKFIPLIMGLLGIVLNIWLSAWKVTPNILLEGLVSGLASTGLHQVFTKLINPHNME